MEIQEELIRQIVSDFPIWQWGCLKTADFTFDPEVRRICESNACGCYGKTWSCPPGFGSYEECKAFCLSYENAFLFTGKYDLEDSYDYDGMMEAREQFQDLSRKIRRYWKEKCGVCVLLGNGGCTLCKSCTYPDQPCRRPDEMLPSLEGYGVLVNRLAEKAGVHYINGKDTVTYFAAILY